MALRASKYTNKKQETKVQLSMSLDEAKAFAKGDAAVVKNVKEAVKAVAQ